MNESYVAERRQETVKLRVAGSRLNDWIFSFFFLVTDETIFVSSVFFNQFHGFIYKEFVLNLEYKPSQNQGQGILSRGLSQGQVQNQTQALYVVCLFKQK